MLELPHKFSVCQFISRMCQGHRLAYFRWLKIGSILARARNIPERHPFVGMLNAEFEPDMS